MRRVMLFLLALIIPACGGPPPGPLDAELIWADGPELYQSPKYGLQVHGLEPSALPAGVGGTSDGTRWLTEGFLTWADIGAALDAGVDQLIAQQPSIAPNSIILAAQSAHYFLVDDYVFWAPNSTIGPTWATGAWQPNTSPVQITLALWSRATGPSEPTGAPTWTIRQPGVDGYNFWRWGSAPLCPACSYEIGHFFGIGLTAEQLAVQALKADVP